MTITAYTEPKSHKHRKASPLGHRPEVGATWDDDRFTLTFNTTGAWHGGRNVYVWLEEADLRDALLKRHDGAEGAIRAILDGLDPGDAALVVLKLLRGQETNE